MRRISFVALVAAASLFASLVYGGSWNQTGQLSAPEAFQAAAADEKFVYAISSQVVAKYDRASGQRVATSTGEAKHLNSGFLWQGKLYCAHSNYPQTPEKSEIKLLDPQSMRLTTFKDLGDFGGSLTWAVRHEDAWWCNFAKYGEQNADTFLVKFSNDWQEQGRWTYPLEVIEKIGRYSFSGGLWHDDSLLVTDHDHQVLYRMQLPESGKVLKFVEQQPAPFSGQGIAIDPKTGGLVGIHRVKRELIYAKWSPKLTLRVLSYNIHHGQGIDGKLDLERIARVIRSVHPDLVALQEVDQKVARSKSVDQPAELAKLTKMHVAFGKNIELQGGGYGNAMLSRWPLAKTKNHLLPNFDAGEQRGVLAAQVDPKGYPESLQFFATHLDHRRADKERIASAEQINKMIGEMPEALAILAGDLNAVPSSDVLKTFRTQWTMGREVHPTVPVGEPARQIDYILYRAASRWRVVDIRVLDEARASDHRAIYAVLEWIPAR